MAESRKGSFKGLARGLKRYELNEGEVAAIPAVEWSSDLALEIHARYPKELDFSFPSPLNGHCYQLRSRGYVGVAPLGNDMALEINPKISSSLLLPMFEYAYRLPKFSDDLLPGSIGDVYEFWAELLARRVLQRIKKGLYRDYEDREGRSPWVRGRLLLDRGRLSAYPYTSYSEHTPDVIENRILANTLHGLRYFAFKQEHVRSMVRRAWWALSDLNYRNIRAGDCLGLEYHRLNHDYRSMHALCYPLLEQRSPGWGLGLRNGEWPAYILHMPTLFEQFCAGYIAAKLPGVVRLETQYRTRLHGSEGLYFRLDLVLFAPEEAKPLAVIDAKYKSESRPQESDIQQVVAYAVQLGINRAFLLYPDVEIKERIKVGPVSVQALGFDLGAGNLDLAGQEVIKVLEEELGSELKEKNCDGIRRL